VIILGIDPGTIKTGYGMVEIRGSRLWHLDSGLIIPPSKEKLEGKILEIFTRLMTLIDTCRPDTLSIEEIFVAKNSRSALVLGHARGVALLAGASKGIPIYGYTPTTVKKCVTGNGLASKEQVQAMVKRLLNLPEVPAEDAADALALAICHAFQKTDARP